MNCLLQSTIEKAKGMNFRVAEVVGVGVEVGVGLKQVLLVFNRWRGVWCLSLLIDWLG